MLTWLYALIEILRPCRVVASDFHDQDYCYDDYNEVIFQCFIHRSIWIWSSWINMWSLFENIWYQACQNMSFVELWSRNGKAAVLYNIFSWSARTFDKPYLYCPAYQQDLPSDFFSNEYWSILTRFRVSFQLENNAGFCWPSYCSRDM